ncbi:energy transducer TonB [Epilithonimonas hungarica]|uniref:Outer membrane transport energization protein TonB n=1 Tax=Epilithonimonas hungarica TaxID=454006 RepID=A0A1G7H627_9FLAO|nr:energy transducer TonB [Epilithonimonas hungarica]SDE95907.1 outer membrane transport energization protein TonB [Epilithonimonas hungarica]
MKNLSAIFGKDNLDEIVFSNRNKAYGAYVLRNEYSNQLTKSVLIGVAFFASLSVVPLIISTFKNETIIRDVPPPVVIEFKDVDNPDIKKPTPTAFVPPNIKTVNITVPNPTRNVVEEKPIPTTEEMKGAAIGPETKSGEETTIPVTPPISIPGPPTTTTISVAPVLENPDIVRSTSEVDVAADFKGGIDAFRQKVSQTFDTESIDHTGVVSGVITFVVERDGSISNIKINGQNADFNKEAERTVKSIKTKWTPAQLNGKAVRSSFRMPISMRIE